MNRKLHACAFMVTSHETKEDYEFFYSHLKQPCFELNLNIDLRFIMQDGSKAESGAIQNFFKNQYGVPSVTVLMC